VLFALFAAADRGCCCDRLGVESPRVRGASVEVGRLLPPRLGAGGSEGLLDVVVVFGVLGGWLGSASRRNSQHLPLLVREVEV
jgi:hypothetical protein